MKAGKFFFADPFAVREYRKNSGLNQASFWGRIGVTQSGGSRYESGSREIPQTIMTLLQLAYAPEYRARKTLEALRQG